MSVSAEGVPRPGANVTGEPCSADTAVSGSAAPGAGVRPLRSERRERAALDALRTLVRDMFLHRHGAREEDAGELALTLSVRADPRDGWRVWAEPTLREQLEEQVDEAAADLDACVLGRVYCFRCRSAACEHAIPPDSLHVFRGYSQTGVPEWAELAQVLIDVRDERVDRLFADPPAVLARVLLGRELRRDQFSYFGRSSKTYSILAQVVAGYFVPARGAGGAAPAGGGRLALTVQVVESRDGEGDVRLRLNSIVGWPYASVFDEYLAGERLSAVDRSLAAAARQLEALESEVEGARAAHGAAAARKVLGRVPAIMTRLARALEQGARQGRRRTRHAQERKRERRPVHKAVEDARHAPDEAVFHDEKHDTWVVLGRQGRAHAFSADGRHVTTLVLAAGGAEFRVRTRRWRRATEGECAAFREALERAVNAG